jgi:hypothetical protein
MAHPAAAPRHEPSRREYTPENDLAFHDSAVYGLLSTDR